MAAIVVVGSTRALCRDHGGPQRVLGGTGLPKSGTGMGFLQPLKDLTTDADGGLLGLDLLDRKAPSSIVLLKCLTERVAAPGDGPYPPPLLVADLEDAPYELMRYQVSGTVHDPAVLIVYLGSPPLK